MSLTQINKAGLDEIALDHVFTIGASGSSAYTFQGEGLNGTVNNPTLYLTRGKTYRFENGSGGHPIRIQSTSGASGTAYNTGVTNNAGSGTVIVEVQHDAPDVLYYQCTSHAAMNGILYITGALADGGVTTAKIADDAVNNDKLANSVVASIAANTAKTSNATHTGDVTGSTSLTIANNAVTTTKIADEAVTLAKLPHGTGSNDGKFLRANNGADPTFETVTGTTINNNADNRVITGSGTANTLEGESGLTFASKILDLNQGNNNANTINGTLQFSNVNHSVAKIEGYTRTTEDDGDIRFYTKNGGTFTEGLRLSFHAEPKLQMLAGETEIVSDATEAALTLRADPGQNRSSSSIKFDVDATVRGRFTSDGLCFGSDTAAANALDDYETGTWTPSLNSGSHTAYSTQWYVKIGQLVTCYFYMYSFSDSSSNTQIKIGGLPFARQAHRESFFHIPCTNSSSFGSGLSGVIGRIGVYGSTTEIALFLENLNGSTGELKYNSGNVNQTHFAATFSYYAD